MYGTLLLFFFLSYTVYLKDNNYGIPKEWFYSRRKVRIGRFEYIGSFFSLVLVDQSNITIVGPSVLKRVNLVHPTGILIYIPRVTMQSNTLWSTVGLCRTIVMLCTRRISSYARVTVAV